MSLTEPVIRGGLVFVVYTPLLRRDDDGDGEGCDLTLVCNLHRNSLRERKEQGWRLGMHAN